MTNRPAVGASVRDSDIERAQRALNLIDGEHTVAVFRLGRRLVAITTSRLVLIDSRSLKPVTSWTPAEILDPSWAKSVMEGHHLLFMTPQGRQIKITAWAAGDAGAGGPASEYLAGFLGNKGPLPRAVALEIPTGHPPGQAVTEPPISKARRAQSASIDLVRTGAFWSKVFSLRIVFQAVILAFIAALLAALLWDPLAYPVGVGTFLLVWLGVAFNSDTQTNCPHCKKMVKLDATVCHRCRRDIRPA